MSRHLCRIVHRFAIVVCMFCVAVSALLMVYIPIWIATQGLPVWLAWAGFGAGALVFSATYETAVLILRQFEPDEYDVAVVDSAENSVL